MNKWKRRARIWGGEAEGLRATADDLRGLVRFHRKDKYALRKQVSGLDEQLAAALHEVEELRRDNVKLATELARVQEVCDRLLVWQRRAIMAWKTFAEASEFDVKNRNTYQDLRQAIEGEPKEEP